MSDSELADLNACLVVEDSDAGYPCRVSLKDACAGEALLLINHVSQAAASPYNAKHAIFVREGAMQARPAPREVPQAIRDRLMSVRAFDASGMMVGADVTEGRELGAMLDAMFTDPDVREIHLHNARPGCFAARVTRV